MRNAVRELKSVCRAFELVETSGRDPLNCETKAIWDDSRKAHRGEPMTTRARWFSLIALALLLIGNNSPVSGQSAHVRWDIISVDFTTPITVNPGGFADAIAPNNGGKIRLTGFGTFVASAGRSGRSDAVTGGGTWETFDTVNVSTGSGTYEVRELVRFELANFQTPGSIIDNIGDQDEAANGYAYLRIEYSDGSQGVLGVFCHGPGAPNGIAEGINATKGFVTYVQVQGPAPLVNVNRTLFHVRE